MRPENEDTLVDLVDEDDVPQRSAPRSEIPEVDYNFRTVHVFVHDGEGRLYLQKLSSRHMRNPHKWGSSVAGYVQAGETYREAAIRKIGEEIGLTVPDGELYEVDKIRMSDRGSDKFVKLLLHQTTDPLQPDPDQIEDLQAFELSTIEHRIRENPERFTETFRVVFDEYRDKDLEGVYPIEPGL